MDWNRERQILTIRNGILVIAFHVLRNNPMIPNSTQGDVFQIISPHYDGKIWQKYSHEDFASVWNRLTCWLSKDILRRRWIVSGVTKHWTVANFENTLPMTIVVFLQMLEISWRFHKWNKKPRKCFLFLR